MGTGGVQHPRAPRFQRPVRLHRLAVGADEHRLPRLHLLRGLHLPGAQRLQPPHHAVVVDDAAQHNAAAGGCGLLRHAHRPLHAVAEPGALRLYHSHSMPPSA